MTEAAKPATQAMAAEYIDETFRGPCIYCKSIIQSGTHVNAHVCHNGRMFCCGRVIPAPPQILVGLRYHHSHKSQRSQHISQFKQLNNPGKANSDAMSDINACTQKKKASPVIQGQKQMTTHASESRHNEHTHDCTNTVSRHKVTVYGCVSIRP